MRRTVRTATIVLGTVAATGLGLTTALAAADTPTSTPTSTPSATATASSGTATPTPTAVVDPPPSYSMTSPTISVPVDPLEYPNTHGICADDFHVAGDWYAGPNEDLIYTPSAHATGDSDVYIFDLSVDENTQNGTDSNGFPYYQGLNVTLGNHSWLHAKSGAFSWTCEPN
jgi:hypothetical protein